MPPESLPRRNHDALHPYRFLPLLLFMGLIFVSSQIPDKSLPWHIERYHLDKALHLLTYGILAAAGLYALQPLRETLSRRWIALIIFLLCLLYGIGDEFHQSFVPGRQMSVWDLTADLTGTLLAIGGWRWRLQKRNS